MSKAYLRRQIERCSQARVSQLDRVLQLLADAEVADFDLVVLRYQHVLRLQVSMKHLIVVNVLQAKG